jgi:ABC-type xylose transport system permease subunit
MRHTVVIYTDTTSKEAVADFMERQRHRRERERRRQQRRWYFIKQRLLGVFLLLFTVFAVYMLDGDATIALITVPLALLMLFSKEMLITNSFYWETEEREKRNDTDIRAFRRDR